eukprot:jgi/Phyca11/15720/fgenesh1_pg.PHYCAscaffold_15_\
MLFNGYKYLEVRETGEHTIDSVPTTTMRDCAEEMHLTLEKESVASSTVIPGRLWDRVSRELDAKYKGQAVRIMARDAVKNLIKYVWKQVHGGDEFRVIESASTDQFEGTLVIGCLSHWRNSCDWLFIALEYFIES